MKQSLIFIVLVLAILAVLLMTSGNKSTPPVPEDRDHTGLKDDKSCLPCHPLAELYKGKHPKKEQCLICHTRKKSSHPS